MKTDPSRTDRRLSPTELARDARSPGGGGIGDAVGSGEGARKDERVRSSTGLRKVSSPTRYRLYDKDGKTKNDHFREVLQVAKQRDFAPRFVLFDSWYSSLENLKFIRDLNWNWLTRFKENRQVSWKNRGNQPVSSLAIPPGGLRVHLRGYGFIRVFETTDPDGAREFWATSDLDMSEKKREKWAHASWNVEVYHRGLKQTCNVERCQARRTSLQRGHIVASVRAFLRLEWRRLEEGVSWYETKKELVRKAVAEFLKNPSVPRHLALGA